MIFKLVCNRKVWFHCSRRAKFFIEISSPAKKKLQVMKSLKYNIEDYITEDHANFVVFDVNEWISDEVFHFYNLLRILMALKINTHLIKINLNIFHFLL